MRSPPLPSALSPVIVLCAYLGVCLLILYYSSQNAMMAIQQVPAAVN